MNRRKALRALGLLGSALMMLPKEIPSILKSCESTISIQDYWNGAFVTVIDTRSINYGVTTRYQDYIPQSTDEVVRVTPFNGFKNSFGMIEDFRMAQEKLKKLEGK